MNPSPIWKLVRYGADYFYGGKNDLYGGPKFAMQANAELHGHGCQLQSNDAVYGYRGFTSYPDWPTAYQLRGGFQRGEGQHDNEIVRRQLPCKPHLDLETHPKGPLPEGYTQDSVIEIVTEACIAVFKSDFLIELPLDSLNFLQSPNPDYFSMHLVISSHSPQYVFRSNHKGDPQGAYQLAIRVRSL